MWRFAPYVLKGLWRHRTRTLLTVAGSAVALFVFAFVGAVREGLGRLTHDRRARRTLVVFQANRFCPFTSRLPEDYARAIGRIPGIRDVVPIKVFTNNCRASLDVIVFYGMAPEKLWTARDLRLVAGDRGEFERRRDAALVGRAVARRRGLEVGGKFSIGELAVTVAGVYAAELPAEENFIYTHLEFLQRARGQNSVGTVTQFEVALGEDADPDAVARAIDEGFRGGPVATDTRPKGVFQAGAVGDLVEWARFADYLGYACVALVLALVATTTVMAVQDRVREHAVLQTLGFSGPRIFGLVVAESLVVGLAGGLVGVGAALGVLAWVAPTIGAEGVLVAFRPSPEVALTGLGVTLAVGVLAGLVPAWQAARADIVQSLLQV